MTETEGETARREALLAVAVAAAQEAGRLHQEHVGRAHTIRTKSTFSDLVTEVDGLAEAAIRRIILETYPDHTVLGEEEGEQGGEQREGGAEYRWVVDPLDGTVNYAHGFPVYCASVAVERLTGVGAGERLAGAVFDATRNELFTATLGGGARLNGEIIRVSGTPALTTPALVSTGFPYEVADDLRNLGLLSKLLRLGVPVRRPGAAALDLCNVACGRMDAYWEIGLKPWDSAAGALIVTEAGGTVTYEGDTVEGKTVTGVRGQAGPHGEIIVASNGRLHRELLDVLGGP